jgi:CheY-like chemotaxis protein
MDIKMPKMNGIEATELIREFNKDVRIIFQSAHALSEEKEKALTSGGNEYLTKPINKEELLKLLTE